MSTRRSFIGQALGTAAGSALVRLAAGQRPLESAPTNGGAVDPMELVNPQFRPALKARLAQGTPPAWNATTLTRMREEMKLGQPPQTTPEVMRRNIPGLSGAPEVVVYIVGAARGAAKPAVLHMHGGGYVAGSAFDSRRNMQALAVEHDCVAVSVEYRLAPETTLAGSRDDNYAALAWLHANAIELGIDRTRIAIKGESAGGGHAANLAILARDRGVIPICIQVLLYPMLDDRTGSSTSVPPYIGHYGWTPESNRFGWTSLLGAPAGSAAIPPSAVPARTTNFSGLPPAWIGVGSIDLFASEDLEYARRLLLAGVATELLLVPGAFHGFNVAVPHAPLSVSFNQSWNTALARAFMKNT